MEVPAILNLFGKSVPIGIIFLIVLQLYLVNEIRHVKKSVSNHITSTNQNILLLRQDMREYKQDMREYREDMKEGFKEIKHIIKERLITA